MTTSFIRQQIDIGIHDIMHQVSQQLTHIVKPMVHNKVKQTKELENIRATPSCNSVSFTNLGQGVHPILMGEYAPQG